MNIFKLNCIVYTYLNLHTAFFLLCKALKLKQATEVVIMNKYELILQFTDLKFKKKISSI